MCLYVRKRERGKERERAHPCVCLFPLLSPPFILFTHLCYQSSSSSFSFFLLVFLFFPSLLPDVPSLPSFLISFQFSIQLNSIGFIGMTQHCKYCQSRRCLLSLSGPFYLRFTPSSSCFVLLSSISIFYSFYSFHLCFSLPLFCFFLHLLNLSLPSICPLLFFSVSFFSCHFVLFLFPLFSFLSLLLASTLSHSPPPPCSQFPPCSCLLYSLPSKINFFPHLFLCRFFSGPLHCFLLSQLPLSCFLFLKFSP